jgi:cobalt-zinc-cadmium efflux system outer membrane protein
MKNFLIACFFVPVFCVSVSAQNRTTDTLRVTLLQAEEQFLKNNLSLIAKHYDIDNASAQVITARLFNNPDFSFSNGVYANDQTAGPAYNEHSFSLSQLFTTAGKRNKNIRLAQLGVQQSREQFFDLMRTLKFTLRSALYNVYYQGESAKVYDEEINALNKTLAAYKEQYAKGNIAQKELLRIQAQLYSLQTEYVGLQTGIDTTESQIRLLLHVAPETYVKPVLTGDITDKLSSVNYQKLLDSAYNNRADLRLAKVTVDYNNVNLSLQRATAIPDFSLSLNYDRLGGYGTDFLGAGIEFNLPFFNRNQGNIKAARVAIDQSKVQLQSQQDQVTSDVATAYKVGLQQMKLYNSFDPAFKADFSHLINEVYINYERRNIGLLEFLDYYDSYKTNTLLINNLKMNLANSLEQLNYVTGTPFFN